MAIHKAINLCCKKGKTTNNYKDFKYISPEVSIGFSYQSMP
jgi:hypothetical protein